MPIISASKNKKLLVCARNSLAAIAFARTVAAPPVGRSAQANPANQPRTGALGFCFLPSAYGIVRISGRNPPENI